jgi:pancreatic triacylglycerol lipase
MKDALLAKSDSNVIVLDWRPFFLSVQARADARLIGVIVGMFLDFLENNFHLNLKDVHLIGHGLGCHLASYVGEYFFVSRGQSPLGRLTALDPVHDAFTRTDPVVRVDSSDALFVDVIHTDSYTGIEGILYIILVINLFT